MVSAPRDEPVDRVLIRVLVHPPDHDALIRAFALDRRPSRRRLLRVYESATASAEHGIALFDRRRPGGAALLTVQIRALRRSLISVATGFRGAVGDRVEVFAEWDGENRALVARLTRPLGPIVPDRRRRVPAGTVLPARQLEFLRQLAGLDLTGSRLAIRDLAELTWTVEISGLLVRIRCRRHPATPSDNDAYELRLRADPRDAPLILPVVLAHLALRGVELR